MMEQHLVKSELTSRIASRYNLSHNDTELAVNQILERISTALSNGERVEIRGFGSFSLHFRKPRDARNPKTGDSVATIGKNAPHFKPGKELRDRINTAYLRQLGLLPPEEDDSRPGGRGKAHDHW